MTQTASIPSAASAMLAPAGNSTNPDLPSTNPSVVDLKCDFVWTHTVSAPKRATRVLLNLVVTVHGLESFLTFAWERVYNHARNYDGLSGEDHEAMVIGSAWVPQGDTNTMVEINT